MKCTQYEICSQAPFKNAKNNVFFEMGQRGQQYGIGSGSKTLPDLLGAGRAQIWQPSEVRRVI